MKRVSFSVNGAPCEVAVRPNRTLLDLLREDLGLIGTKDGCSQGVCGACTVLVDGRTHRACLFLAVRADGRRITTVEGLRVDGRLHPLQRAFIDEGAVQCGFCTPGMLIAACALLEETPRPSEREVREALIGNLCRCTGYARIVRAVLAAVAAGAAGPGGGRP